MSWMMKRGEVVGRATPYMHFFHHRTCLWIAGSSQVWKVPGWVDTSWQWHELLVLTIYFHLQRKRLSKLVPRRRAPPHVMAREGRDGLHWRVPRQSSLQGAAGKPESYIHFRYLTVPLMPREPLATCTWFSCSEHASRQSIRNRRPACTFPPAVRSCDVDRIPSGTNLRST